MKLFLKSGKGVIIVEADESMVNLSAYRMTTSQDAFEEIATPDCKLPPFYCLHDRECILLLGLLEGSAYVSQRAKAFLKGYINSCLSIYHH
jgi:hypothetical protein